MLPFQLRPREGAGVLALHLMGPKVSTVKIFSPFQKLVSVHSSCSPTRIAIAQWGAHSHRRAPTLTELCNKVPRGSRRKLHPPSCELIFIFHVPVRPTLILLCSVGKPLALTAFGLVTQGNLASFVPFNATTPVTTSSKKRKGLLYHVSFPLVQHGVVPPLQARAQQQSAQASLINSNYLRTQRGCKVSDHRK